MINVNIYDSITLQRRIILYCLKWIYRRTWSQSQMKKGRYCILPGYLPIWFSIMKLEAKMLCTLGSTSWGYGWFWNVYHSYIIVCYNVTSPFCLFRFINKPSRLFRHFIQLPIDDDEPNTIKKKRMSIAVKICSL